MLHFFLLAWWWFSVKAPRGLPVEPLRETGLTSLTQISHPSLLLTCNKMHVIPLHITILISYLCSYLSNCIFYVFARIFLPSLPTVHLNVMSTPSPSLQQNDCQVYLKFQWFIFFVCSIILLYQFFCYFFTLHYKTQCSFTLLSVDQVLKILLPLICLSV